MNLYKALAKVDKLSPAELRHCIQLMDIEIQNYSRCCKNYGPEKWEKYAEPYLNTLQRRKERFEMQLKFLQEC